MRPTALRHSQLPTDDGSIHVVEHGRRGRPGVLFLHGWPQDASAFAGVTHAFGDDAHLIAIDLPGIGGSEPTPASGDKRTGDKRTGDKRTLAGCVMRVMDALELPQATLVGHDIGAQIAYACLHEHPERLVRAVLMNAAIPGVEPWSQVVRHPQLWHFAFHALPELPELLVADHVARYFDFFYDTLAASPRGLGLPARAAYAAAYARPDALRAGFDWYRAFAQDERDNQRSHGQHVATPVLYLRGEREPVDLDAYLDGLRASGLQNVHGERIADCGHFAPDEQPAAVAEAIRRFVAAPQA